MGSIKNSYRCKNEFRNISTPSFQLLDFESQVQKMIFLKKSMYRDKGNQFSSVYYRFLVTDLFVQMDLFLEVPNNDLLVLH